MFLFRVSDFELAHIVRSEPRRIQRLFILRLPCAPFSFSAFWVVLFPDGTGSVTPSVSEIQLDYTVLPEPQPPYKVSAQKGDGSVTLSWSYSTDDTAGGYYIYYGTRPGEYLGRYAAEGNSPIDVGNTTSYTITGLKNGTIYYFAIAAWSKVDSRIRGPLSKEVYARPGVK